jgi:multisubunit Na+/H+ antiporter MnhB subunit
MTTTALILAAAGRGEQDPGGGLSALLIALVVVGVILLFAGIMFTFHHVTKRTRGGVEPRPDEFQDRGNPPFESIARRH